MDKDAQLYRLDLLMVTVVSTVDIPGLALQIRLLKPTLLPLIQSQPLSTAVLTTPNSS